MNVIVPLITAPDTVVDIVTFCGAVLSIFVILSVDVELTFPATSIDLAYIVQLFDTINVVVYVCQFIPSSLYSFFAESTGYVIVAVIS